MRKNTAGKWVVFAFGGPAHATLAGLPVTGDAANITANIRIDGGAANAVDDSNPTELEDGFYIFDTTAAETNGDQLTIAPVSATSNVLVIGVPAAVYTVDAVPVVTISGTLTTLDALDTAQDSQHSATQALATSVKAVTDVIPDSGAMSSLATAAALATVDGNVDSILVDTGTTLPASLAAIAGYIDTEVAAILADTGTTLDGKLDAIKAITDQMVFTQTNQLDVNTLSINSAEVVGDGSSTPWNGA